MIDLKLRQGGRPRAPMGRPLQIRPGIRVEPRDETMRRLLRHPKAGRFRASGSIEWPDDRYTRKRLNDGSIKLAVVKPPETKPLDKVRESKQEMGE
jgi:hypothetical protein